jgi:pilus assembly protein Flp/PilA
MVSADSDLAWSLAFHVPLQSSFGVQPIATPPYRRWEQPLKTGEMKKMKNLIVNSLVRLHKDEAGQGLIEYVLIIALVAFAATAGMSSLASGVNSAFTAVSTILGSYIT